MEITRTSIVTGKTRTLDLPVTEEQLKVWANGDGPLIQYCFPNLDADDREFIISGITPDEWDEAFTELPEDELNEWDDDVAF